MNNKTRFFFLVLNVPSFFVFAASPSLAGPGLSAQQRSADHAIRIENLEHHQQFTENVPAFFRIAVSAKVNSVRMFLNGLEIGLAKREAISGPTTLGFKHSFKVLGEQDLVFAAFSQSEASLLAQQTVRINVLPFNAPKASRYFNSYILKAVDHLTKHWGLLGYDITKQITHPIDYNKMGILKPTGDGLTMCVSGVLETILTAFELYAAETGNRKIYDFLPFDSWNTLRPTNIKAYIWVDDKLNSNGTADALAKFGLGEVVRFQDLEPGAFININRTTGSGHAVVFLSFIDIKGQDLAKYSDKVAGFRYFGAQGKRAKGQGGFSYRHAFFSKNGCPEVPYQRDCDVIYSDSQKLFTTGMMLDPADWKQKPLSEAEAVESDSPSQERKNIRHAPAEFNGLTTDD